MSSDQQNGSNYPRLITIFAIVFGVSLGLCGLQVALAFSPLGNKLDSLAGVFSVFGFLELGAMLISGVGLLVTTIAWVFSGIYGGRADGTQRLFGDIKEEETSDSINVKTDSHKDDR